EESRLLEGKDLPVLVAQGEGRKDGATRRLSGRAPDNRLVHFAVPADAAPPRPGDVATVRVTYGAPHHLVADAALSGGPFEVRRTAAGDAWQARRDRGDLPVGPASVEPVSVPVLMIEPEPIAPVSVPARSAPTG
ncbi:MAG: tRNA-2-methylthio-N6-dimethylallyladenosine synthase, partial [Actinomycetota bacterium]|nr:tRNA-2-methylthio-N6-dimethylallyladenosine synthase [Actinomycetota bacterium]